MSWAVIARKAKEAAEAAAPESLSGGSNKRKTVVVTCPSSSCTATGAKHGDSRVGVAPSAEAALSIPTPQKGCLVLDANAIIHGMEDYVSRADVLITTPEVLAECKDPSTRELLARLALPLTVRSPTLQSVQKVIKIATATGDIGILSRTDIHLCALAYDVARQLGVLGTPIEPRDTLIRSSASGVEPIIMHDDDDVHDDEDDDELDDEQVSTAQSAADEEECDDGLGGSDGEGEWITGENVADMQIKHSHEDDGINTDPYASGFAAATSDFPMQNVLMHLGVPVVGPRGLLIRELRQWLLRCHACFCLVTDTTRQFCPDCGSGNTLKRVSYVINQQGEKHLFINFKKNISTRGTVYTLPKPRGGRNGTNRTLVLREDQLHPSARGAAQGKRRVHSNDDPLGDFGVARTKARDAMQLRTTSAYKKYNVNEKKKLRAARRR